MKAFVSGLFLALVPFASGAAPLLVSPAASWAGTVADNIKQECDLPAAQSQAVLEELAAVGITAQAAGSDAVPASGRFLQLRIESAVSAGNAFMGHHKEVTTSAHLFQNGKEVAQTTLKRDSMGGAFGGYMSSCAVLHRCTNTLGKDVADWVKSQPAK